MRGEAKPIIEKLNLKYLGKISDHFRNDLYCGLVNNYTIYLVTNGVDGKMDCVGAEAVTVGTAIGIQRFKPDLLLNIGTAGALSTSSCIIGDIFMA